MLVVRVIDKRTLIVIHYTGSEKCCEEQVQYGSMQAAAVVGTALIAPTDKSALKAKKIMEDCVSFDLSVEILEQLEYEPGVAINIGQKAITRARERLDETDYNLLFKNCESFVNWAITTREETNQGELGTFGLIAAAGGLALLAGVGIGAALYASSTCDEDEEKASKRGRKKGRN